MRPVLILVLSLFTLGVGSLAAQADAVPAAPVAAPAAQVDAGASEQPPSAGGLPQREAPTRTMRAYWHVFIAFAVVWLLLFGYAVTVGQRFGKLEEEVRRLRGTG